MPPTITSVSGTLADGNVLTISGSNFGTKSPTKPVLWADFKSNLNATNLGLYDWDIGGAGTGNEEWSSEDGGCARTTPVGQDSATLGIYNGNGWVGYGGRLYIYRRTRTNVVISGSDSSPNNWKTIRFWYSSNDQSISLPDVYQAVNNGSVGAEGSVAGVSTIWYDPSWSQLGSNALYLNRPIDYTNYHSQEWEILMESANGNSNGKWRFYQDGIYIQTTRGGQVNDTMGFMDAGSHFWTLLIPVHNVVANKENWSPAWNASTYRTWSKDVYVDTTWARVMISSYSTWDTSVAYKSLVPQPPSAWSSTSITVTAVQGPLTSLNGSYLYVVDSAGSVNSSGYQLGSAESLVGGYRIS